MLMKSYIFTIYFVAIFFSANAQTIDITGSVADSISKQNLSYGNIIVKNRADSIISGALTDESGNFKIRNIIYRKGMYILVKYLGYADKKIEINYSNNPKIDFEEILLRPNVSLIKEATIVGKTNYMEQKFDRKVFNISDDKATSAKNIFDLLRTLPGVTVDEDDNVIYKGAPATIYVDDQPAEYIYPKTEMIPVASVLKIELIDASLSSGAGKGGIINIKMKNLATDGISGIIQTDNRTVSFKDLNNTNNYINVNYKIKKVIFFDNLNYGHNISNSNSKTNGTLNYDSSIYSLNSNANSKNNFDNFWNYGGIRYSPDDNTRCVLTCGFYNNYGEFPYESSSQQKNSANQLIYEEYNYNSMNYNHWLGKWLSASFYHKFDTIGKELSSYGNIANQQNNQIINNTYNYQYISSNPVDSIYKYVTNMKWSRLSFNSGITYNNPINKNTRWNCGWNGYFAFKSHDNNTYFQNNEIYYPLTALTNNLFQEQTAYCRIGTTVKKWKFDIGVSAQFDKNNVTFTRFNVDSEDTLLNVLRNYFHTWPSTTIVFSPDSSQEIKLTYTKSIRSLDYNQLCDFVDKTNQFSWSVGNSKLEPTSFNNFYLGYLYNKSTWNFNADLFYSLTNNAISNIVIPISDVITETIPENVAHNSSVGIELSSWISINKKYDFNLSSSINHTKLSAVDFNGNESKESNFGYNFKFNTNIHINDKTSGTFYVNYFSRAITLQGYKFNYVNSSLSLTRKFFDKKLLLTLGINNILNNLAQRGAYYNYAGIIRNTIQNSSIYIPTYFITLQYKFRQGDRETKDSGNIN